MKVFTVPLRTSVFAVLYAEISYFHVSSLLMAMLLLIVTNYDTKLTLNSPVKKILDSSSNLRCSMSFILKSLTWLLSTNGA